MSTERVGDRPTSWAAATSSGGDGGAREALTFLLSEDGAFLGGWKFSGGKIMVSNYMDVNPKIGVFTPPNHPICS